MPAGDGASSSGEPIKVPPARMAVVTGCVIWALAGIFALIVALVTHYQVIFVGFWLLFFGPVFVGIGLPCASIVGLYYASKGRKTMPWLAGVGYVLNGAALLVCVGVTWQWIFPGFTGWHG